ncbi:MAG: hypothetical protein KJO11_03875 [Gemmatimonadetes bacterium]|nr:hypothetical protein [Gemmatimonadota bacterium]
MPSIDEKSLIRTTKLNYDQISGMSTRPTPSFPPANLQPGFGGGAPGVGSGATADPADAIEPIWNAFRFAHDLWRQQAGFRDVVIHGPTATGGRLEGPDLGALMKSAPSLAVPSAVVKEYGTPIAEVIGETWARFVSSVSVPGLAWYPTFAAWPGPVAPPTPNVPTPFIMLQFHRDTISETSLERALAFRIGQGKADALCKAVAKGLAQTMELWMSAQPVTQVMGQGRTSANPPTVPVGPVVAGTILPTPGHLAG